MTEKTKSTFLAVHLRAHGGHCGRSNPELARLASAVGLSVHTLQSMALGRRTIGDSAKAKLRESMRHGRE